MSAPIRPSYNSQPGRFGSFLVRNYRSVIIGIILVFVLVEVIEQIAITPLGGEVHALYDALVYTILAPASLWFLLHLLASTTKEKHRNEQDFSQRLAFRQKLTGASGLNDLLNQIVTFVQETLPSAAVILYVRHPGSGQMVAEISIEPDGQVQLRGPGCPPLADPLPTLTQQLTEPAAAPQSEPGLLLLPLVRGGHQVGLIRAELPDGSRPSGKGIDRLVTELPVISMALEEKLLEKLAADQTAASSAERQRIAQNLHDSLAQNISYLRFKLDQFTADSAIQANSALYEDLQQMRATADEAYQQVRSTLDELITVQAEDLAGQLMAQANTIGLRAGFSLRARQAGTPFDLPPAVRQQVLLISREALHNIEKHAGACQVHLQLLWIDTGLIVKITDDGGGFDPSTVANDGHYGLWIMQRRAQEIGGSVSIQPADPHGTEVTLWAPRNNHNQGEHHEN